MKQQPTSQQLATPIQVVQSFLMALSNLDVEGALEHLTEDAEYQNYPLPPDRGKRQVRRTLRFLARIFSELAIDTHHIAESEGVVLTERTDVLRGRFVDLTLKVCGTFHVRHGKIVLWRDHFDMSILAWQLLSSPFARANAARSGEKR